jgi:alcohol dehydrogenase
MARSPTGRSERVDLASVVSDAGANALREHAPTMNAVVYHEFGGNISLAAVPDPTPEADGAVIQVTATGLCRSDWHGWRGRDPDIKSLPHVPGHEFAGVVVAVGPDADRALIGERVTIPFVAGCGTCFECERGNEQVCDRQFQPGFTAWGSFAEFVAVRYANRNLVRIPDEMSNVAAAALGCRIATAYRAVAAQAAVQPGQWVAVHGCGGVGLSAVMIAHALGARVIAVDVRAEPLALAKQLGAETLINAREVDDVPAAIREVTERGADASIDAVGGGASFANSVLSLRKRGRHVQVGLMTPEDVIPPELVGRVLSWELEVVGSHGIQAHAYPKLFELVRAGKLNPLWLVDRTMTLGHAPYELAAMEAYRGCGVTVFSLEGERSSL